MQVVTESNELSECLVYSNSISGVSSMAMKDPLIESDISTSSYPQPVLEDTKTDSFYNNGEFVNKYRNTGSINRPLLKPVPPRLPHRLVHKDGTAGALLISSSSQRGKAYVFDVYTTLIDCKWWVFILLIVLTYIISYVLFGGAWYCASLIPDSDEANSTCVIGVNDVLSAMFLSVEVQSTIGFGSRHPRSDYNCIPDFIILFAQTIVGLFIDAFYLALIVTKISRPYRRKATILFSNKAAVSREGDGRWFLSFRVTDIRKVKLIEPHIKLYLFHLAAEEGNGIRYECHDLDVGYDQGTDRLQLVLPSMVRHEISPSSPLYRLSPSQLREENFELVAVLEGIVEGTGSTTQVMTSYRGAEIEFGMKFVNLLELNSRRICVNLVKFHVMTKSEEFPLEVSVAELEDSSADS